MNQSTNSNESLAQLLNHKSNSPIIHKLFTQALDSYLAKGLITDKERTSLSMKSSLSNSFLYKQFVVARHELATTFGCPLSMISDENLLELLEGGRYSWAELEAMNDDVEREMLVEINSEEEE